MRELMRSIARANMEAYGIKNINKKRAYRSADGRTWTQSFFAANWRKWLSDPKSRK